MKIKQGEIYLANLSFKGGHEQSGYRPVLIMQNNFLNDNLNTAIVAPMTSNLAAKGKLTTHFLPKNLSRLNFDSIILLFQMRTIDMRKLKKRVSFVGDYNLKEIKKQLKFIF